MRLMAMILAAGMALLPAPLPASAQAAPSGPACFAESEFVAVSGTVPRRIPSLLEVELTIRNTSAIRIHVDPAEIILAPDRGGPVRPLTADQARDAVRGPVVFVYWWFSVGPIGVLIGAESPALYARDVELRILRPAEILPGTSLRGSVYFQPDPGVGEFTVTLDGLTGESRDRLPAVQLSGCAVPGRAPSAVRSSPEVKTYAPNARAVAGPLQATVSTVLLAKDAASLTLTIANTGAADAALFNAIADATLTDSTGRVYAVRVLRSHLPDRIPAGGRIRGRLMFEPLRLPPAITGATLRLPGIVVGSVAYDLNIDLGF